MVVAIVILMVAFVVFYDVFIGFFMGVDQTIIIQTYRLAQEYPILPFVVGIAIGRII